MDSFFVNMFNREKEKIFSNELKLYACLLFQFVFREINQMVFILLTHLFHPGEGYSTNITIPIFKSLAKKESIHSKRGSKAKAPDVGSVLFHVSLFVAFEMVTIKLRLCL